MPDSENPYAAPKSQDVLEFGSQRAPIWVEGDFLVVSDGVQLPPRCVFTNEPVGEPVLRQILKWAPSFRPVISEQRIRLRFAVNGRRRRKQRWVRVIGISSQLLTAALFYKLTGILFVSAMLVVSATVMLLEKPTFLRITKCKNDRFWLKGCGPAFLASCLDEFGTQHQPRD